MTLRDDGTMLIIEGACPVEDALPLLEALQAAPSRPVDLGACTSLHTAALQVLLALRPPVVSVPTDPFLARWIGPLLDGVSREARRALDPGTGS